MLIICEKYVNYPENKGYSDHGTAGYEKGMNDARMVSESSDKVPISATNETKNEINETKSETDIKKNAAKSELSQDKKKILSVIRKNSRITQKKLHEATGISLGTIRRILPRLRFI